jgi:hypothetical protein
MSCINFGSPAKALLIVVPALVPLYLTRHPIPLAPIRAGTLSITVVIMGLWNRADYWSPEFLDSNIRVAAIPFRGHTPFRGFHSLAASEAAIQYQAVTGQVHLTGADSGFLINVLA